MLSKSSMRYGESRNLILLGQTVNFIIKSKVNHAITTISINENAFMVSSCVLSYKVGKDLITTSTVETAITNRENIKKAFSVN
jgi:hypothetical protein